VRIGLRVKTTEDADGGSNVRQTGGRRKQDKRNVNRRFATFIIKEWRQQANRLNKRRRGIRSNAAV
jgi:hypothetical protein